MKNTLSKPLLFIVSGPSGSGKKTLMDYIVEKYSTIKKLPTYTTRKIREGEIQGVDYNYISKDEFLVLVENKKIFEYTKTYNDDYYGSPIEFLESKDGKNLLVELDYKGMLRVKTLSSFNVISIFIVPPPINVLINRIQKRSNEDNMKDRLAVISEQLQFAWTYDYVLYNFDKNKFYEEINYIINAELIRKKGIDNLVNNRHDDDPTLGE